MGEPAAGGVIGPEHGEGPPGFILSGEASCDYVIPESQPPARFMDLLRRLNGDGA